MNLVDTHAHLFVEEFSEDIDEVVLRAKRAGVTKVFLPNISEGTIGDLKRCTSRYPDFFYPMMGLHPTSVTENWRDQLDKVYSELIRGEYIAVGEVGIDLHWNDSLREAQVQAFEAQLEWSREHDLALSIHFRKATKEVVESIRRVGERSLRGVFHSFSGNREELELLMSLDNFFIGVNGVITFRNSGLGDTLKYCPRDRLIVETDAPYLSPAPYRGKRNESGYLPFIVESVARAWQTDSATVAEISTRNARALFGLKG